MELNTPFVKLILMTAIRYWCDRAEAEPCHHVYLYTISQSLAA